MNPDTISKQGQITIIKRNNISKIDLGTKYNKNISGSINQNTELINQKQIDKLYICGRINSGVNYII